MTQYKKLIRIFMILFAILSALCLLIGIMLTISTIIRVDITSWVTKLLTAVAFIAVSALPSLGFLLLRNKIKKDEDLQQEEEDREEDREGNRNVVCKACGGTTANKEINCQYCGAPLEA